MTPSLTVEILGGGRLFRVTVLKRKKPGALTFKMFLSLISLYLVFVDDMEIPFKSPSPPLTALMMNLEMGRKLLRVTRRYWELSMLSPLVESRAGSESLSN